jgi:hypothetical protein
MISGEKPTHGGKWAGLPQRGAPPVAVGTAAGAPEAVPVGAGEAGIERQLGDSRPEGVLKVALEIVVPLRGIPEGGFLLHRRSVRARHGLMILKGSIFYHCGSKIFTGSAAASAVIAVCFLRSLGILSGEESFSRVLWRHEFISEDL